MATTLGRRMGLKAAAKHLQVTETRMRLLVRTRQVAYARPTPRGMFEFFEKDLDEYLEKSRVLAVLPAPEKPARRHVDAEMQQFMKERGAQPFSARH